MLGPAKHAIKEPQTSNRAVKSLAESGGVNLLAENFKRELCREINGALLFIKVPGPPGRKDPPLFLG